MKILKNGAQNQKRPPSRYFLVLNPNLKSLFENSQNFSHFQQFLTKKAEFLKILRNGYQDQKIPPSSFFGTEFDWISIFFTFSSRGSWGGKFQSMRFQFISLFHHFLTHRPGTRAKLSNFQVQNPKYLKNKIFLGCATYFIECAIRF